MKTPRISFQIIILLISVYITYKATEYLYSTLLTGSDTSFKIALTLTTISLGFTLFTFAYIIWYLISLTSNRK